MNTTNWKRRAKPYCWLLAVAGLASGITLAFTVQRPQPESHFPQDQWRVSPLEAQGMDSGPVIAMFDQIAQKGINIHSIHIIRHGYLVLDAYFYPFPRDTLHDGASVTKSITSALIGIALDKGFLKNTNQTVLGVLPDRRPARLDARKEAITLEALLKMSSGLDCGYRAGEPELFEMMKTDRWAEYVLDLPMREEAGSRFAYCSGGMHLLSAVLSKATNQSALDFAREHLFGPLGINDAYWLSDPQGINHGWGDLYLRPLDMAKIGYLYLKKGRWNERQVISAKWIEQSLRRQIKTGRQDDYGYGWWISGSVPGLSEAVGRGGQRIIVWPEKDVVVAFTGGGFEPGELAPFLISALKRDQPLPANPEGNRRLQKKIAIAARPPAPVKTPMLPAIASAMSGKLYQLRDNLLGIRSLRVRFVDGTEGEITLSLSNRQIVIPLGLDGVYRIGVDHSTKLPIGGKAVWQSANELMLDLNFIAAINRFQLKLRLEGDTVAIHLSEATGLVNEEITGVAQK